MSTRLMVAMAGLTLREALGTGLAWAAAALIAGVLVLAQFAGALSLSEARETQAVLAASGLRIGGVVLLALFIASSVSREADDKWLEVLMALPLPRWQFLCAKVLGFGAAAFMFAVLCGLALCLLAQPLAVLAWSASLFAELLIVVAFTLFCALSLRHVTLAVCAVLAFYLLARIMDALRLMASGPMLADEGAVHAFLATFLEGLALLLPALGRFTDPQWLIMPLLDMGAVLSALAQALLYTLVLVGASLVDLYRRNL